MNGIIRAFIGALGGLAAWMSKLLALDAAKLSQLVEQEQWVEATELKVTIFIVLPILVFLGAVVAWLTDENLRMKLFAIGVSAPAIIAPWTTKAVLNDVASLDHAGFVTTAHAQTVKAPGRGGIFDGLKILLGIQDLPDPKAERYWVIVSSHADLDAAFRTVADVNRQKPELAAFVGNRMPGNPLYPVIVGGEDGYLTLNDAKKLKEFTDKLGLAKGGSYLSAYADRFPADGVPR